MQFNEPVQTARLLKRYKRFFADVLIDGEVVTAHVPNTGSLITVISENAECIVTKSLNPKRKLKWTLQLVRTDQGWAGVNTSLPNHLVVEAFRAGRIEDWRPYGFCKPEHKISAKSRIDLVLAQTAASFADQQELCFIEIKNVTLSSKGVARFPDAVTERGQKHLVELTNLVERGHRAEIVFVVQRENCRAFAPADEIDKEYGRLLREASRKGVRARALGVKFQPNSGLEITGEELPVQL